MKRVQDLCRPCAEITKETYALKVVVRGSNRKITCEMCHRRRYGVRYELTKREASA